MIEQNDKLILRELAKQYAELALGERNEEKLELYRRINQLEPIRPVVLVDELPWHEMDWDGSLALRCESEVARVYEDGLRKNLFRSKYFPADTYFTPFIPVRKIIRNSGYGLAFEDRILQTDSRNHIVSHEYIDLLKNDDDLNQLVKPTITYAEEQTTAQYQEAEEIFAGILPIHLVGVQCHWNPWDDISRHRGVQPLLMGLVDEPEFMHRVMEKLLEIVMFTFDEYERLDLLNSVEYYIHCTAGYCDDLLTENKPKTTKQMWGRGTAQIFGSVSKEMHDEFDIAYMKRLMQRFGVVYYGCCEPLHNKIDIVEKIPNLRKISITPWADVDVAADCIGSKYVLASKPNPAYVAELSFDAERVRDEILRVLKACKRNGTTCEFVLKDISTCKGRPQNIFEWEQVVMKTVRDFE